MELPIQICEVLERLESAGYSAFVVGGCVRDHIMGLVPHDFDITTSATPLETERVFADCHIVETGIKHGTVTVLYKGGGSELILIEITTFRVDGDYSDGRHPDSVLFSRNITDDLSRRDFTINGIAYNPKVGFVDPFGGASDIKAGVIRCIGDPDERFGEDALRVVRALRFSATLGFAIDEQTARAMEAHRYDVRRVSAERIFTELKRMLCGRDIKRVMLEFPWIFAMMIPQLAITIDYDQRSKYHNSTLYEHTARAVEAAPPTVHMRLAMLLHDIAKPACRTSDDDEEEDEDDPFLLSLRQALQKDAPPKSRKDAAPKPPRPKPQGECHYYGHAKLSDVMADDILRDLNCDNALRERVCHIIRYHDIPIDTGRRYIKRQLAKHGLEVFTDIMNAHIADDSAKCDFCLERIPKEREMLAIAKEISREAPCLSVKMLAITGNDLKELVPPSPLMGEILSQLLAEVVDETLPNEREALLARARSLLENRE